MSERSSQVSAVRSLLPERAAVLDGLHLLRQSLLLGTIAGMATFTYVQHDFALPWVSEWIPLALVGFTGLLNFYIDRELSRGLWISFGAMAIAYAVYIVAWMLPLYLAGYPPLAIKLLFFNRFGQGMLSVTLVLPMTYYGTYFAALIGLGAFRA